MQKQGRQNICPRPLRRFALDQCKTEKRAVGDNPAAPSLPWCREELPRSPRVPPLPCSRPCVAHAYRNPPDSAVATTTRATNLGRRCQVPCHCKLEEDQRHMPRTRISMRGPPSAVDFPACRPPRAPLPSQAARARWERRFATHSGEWLMSANDPIVLKKSKVMPLPKSR